jgi:HSP20 family molecular chaperone IbpA
MSTVLIKRVRHLNGGAKPPAFAEVEKTIEKIQRRAYNLFERRGGLSGLDMDDWLLAEHAVLGSSSAELLESDKELKLMVAVPGLIVQANARHRHSGADGEIRFCEFSDDKLCREFGLPSPIDVNTVSASLDKGMLNVVAAKTAKSNGK